MGVGLLIGLIALLLFIILGIGILIYSRKKKSKIGLAISITILLVVSFLFLTNTIDEISISKKDIISDLSHINIEIIDDFKITNNKVTGMPERIQETEIQISQMDKDRLISEIRNSTNFKSFSNSQKLINDTDNEQFGTSSIIFNFKYSKFYSRETYTKIDNYPTRLFLSIYDKSNTIKYQRIEH
jgi:predicted PurR-regulated permease PerM